MKKRLIILMLAVIAIVTIFSGCAKTTECDLCGEVKKCKEETVMGEDVYICEDCSDDLEELEDMFG